MNANSGNIRVPILDRLIDREPDVSFEPVPYRLAKMREIRASVIRDLEHLLNTRRTIDEASRKFPQLNQSVFHYGLKDFTSSSTKDSGTRKELRQEIERAIAIFEPRLRNVRVVTETDHKEHSLKFKVNAVLVVEPEREPVQFDTLFDVNRGQYLIKE